MIESIRNLTGQRSMVTVRGVADGHLAGVLSIETNVRSIETNVDVPDHEYEKHVVVVDDGSSIHRVRLDDVLTVTVYGSKA